MTQLVDRLAVAQKLGDIAQIRAGVGFPISLQGNSDGTIPFFKVGDISRAWQRREMFLKNADHYLTSAEVKALRASPFPANTVVFAKIGAAIGLNRRAILSQESLVDNNVMGVVGDPGSVDPRYLFHFLRTIRLLDSSRASVVPSIRKSDVEAIEIPLPDISVQRAVVAKVEELLSDLDAGVAALQRAKANLARYRAAVLKAAVEGKLTEQWRREHPDVEPASDLLRRVLAERRKKWEEEQLAKYEAKGRNAPKGWRERYQPPAGPAGNDLPPLPSSWCWAATGQVTYVQSGIQKQPIRAPKANAYPYLRVANVLRGRLDLTKIHRFELFDGELDRLRLESGDLLVVEGNGSRTEIGRSALWRGEIENCVHQNHIIRVRPVEVIPEYVNYYWNSPQGSGRVMQVAASTSGLYTLSVSKVGAVPTPLPPLAEQKFIAAAVAEALSDVDQMTTVVNAAGARAVGVRQGILREAFSGKLV